MGLKLWCVDACLVLPYLDFHFKVVFLSQNTRDGAVLVPSLAYNIIKHYRTIVLLLCKITDLYSMTVLLIYLKTLLIISKHC